MTVDIKSYEKSKPQEDPELSGLVLVLSLLAVLTTLVLVCS